MPRIATIVTATPPHRVRQEEASGFVRNLFGCAALDVERLLPIFVNTEVEERGFSVPMEWFAENHTFAEKNRVYLESALGLSERAVREACTQARIEPERIGHVFLVSTTGLATPSLDAHLFNRVPFHPSILRTPIWGLGCAGGLAGMARASDWLKAYPDSFALVVAVELCGLTFVRNDASKSNFVACALFGDGCAAALLAGDGVPAGRAPALKIENSAAVTWKGTLDVMGWDLCDEGLKVRFSRSIPALVAREGRAAILSFLARSDRALKDVDFFLSHPGGTRVMEAYRKTLGFEENQVRSMREVMARNGNMSSATVLFVLDHFLRSHDYRKDARVLSVALGPGFSAEFLLASCI